MVRPDKCRKTGVMNLVIGVKGVVGDDVLDALVSRNVKGAAGILSLNFILTQSFLRVAFKSTNLNQIQLKYQF